MYPSALLILQSLTTPGVDHVIVMRVLELTYMLYFAAFAGGQTLTTSVVHQTADTNHTVEIKVMQVKFLTLRVINPPDRICRYASSSKTTFVLIS